MAVTTANLASAAPAETGYILDQFSTVGEDFPINRQEFRFTAVRPDIDNIDISGLVVSAEWRDEGTADNLNSVPVLRGTLNLIKPDFTQLGAEVQIEDGHRVRCDVRWAGQWTHLWEMRILTPAIQLQDGNWTFELADDIQAVIGLNEGTFRYRRGKTKKRSGWRYDEIIRDIAKHYRVPLGEVVKGTYRMKNFDPGRTTVIDAMRQAVEKEQAHTGRRYVMVWKYSAKAGRYALHVVRLRRNPLLYVLQDQILTASIETIRDAALITACTAHGSGKKKGSKKRKRYTSRYVDPAGVKRYGYINRVIDLQGNIDSQGEMDRETKRYVARHMKPKHVVSIGHVGIAFLRRGDAVRMEIPSEGLSGKTGIVFITSVIHSLSAGGYTMDLTLQFVDPLDPKKLRAERDAALRARKRKKAK